MDEQKENRDSRDLMSFLEWMDNWSDYEIAIYEEDPGFPYRLERANKGPQELLSEWRAWKSKQRES